MLKVPPPLAVLASYTFCQGAKAKVVRLTTVGQLSNGALAEWSTGNPITDCNCPALK
jgi:hypothetical protein